MRFYCALFLANALLQAVVASAATPESTDAALAIQASDTPKAAPLAAKLTNGMLYSGNNLLQVRLQRMTAPNMPPITG